MKPLSLIFSFLMSIQVFAQHTKTITGTIVNAETGQPVEFVNIGFNSIRIGTVSKSNGTFLLELRKNLSESGDQLIISSIGYETEYIPSSEWSSWTSISNRIMLHPKTTQLDPVVIRSGKRGYDRLGSESYSLSELGFWNDKGSLGGELATRIGIDKERTRLHNFKFHVIRNEADSVKVRINIYRCHNNMPGENILHSNIYHMITRSRGVEEISLKEHNIVVDNDIVVGIEMVEAYGEDLYLSVSASHFGGTAYLRERSQSGCT